MYWFFDLSIYQGIAPGRKKGKKIQVNFQPFVSKSVVSLIRRDAFHKISRYAPGTKEIIY